MPPRSRPVSSAADPLAETVLATLDRRLDAAGPLALAFSGGGDSTALLHLVAGWSRARARPLVVLTLDHGLNPESGRWTDEAGRAARALGLDWRPLAWTGDKPETGLPAAARAARHALLADAARDAGARVILTGHTLDDVLESELIRTETPGLGRLADWSPSPAWPQGRGLFLCRPLLGVRRAALRAWLSERATPWLDDPANDDGRYARVRARRALSCVSSAGADDAARGGAGPARPEPPSPAHAPFPGERPDGLIDLDRRTEARVLAAALLCAAGTSIPPRGDRLDALHARIRAGETFTATLAGARIEAAERLLIGRDPGRAGLPTVETTPGRRLVWDGRFELVAAGAAVAPAAGRMARLSKADRASLAALPAWARPTLPVDLHPGGAAKLAAARPLSFGRLRAALGQVTKESDI